MQKQWILAGVAMLAFAAMADEPANAPCDPLQTLELRMDALSEEDDAVQLELLFRSFSADPLHETRSAELLGRLLVRHQDEKQLQRIDGFCAKYPDSIGGILLRYLCGRRLRPDDGQLGAALKRTVSSLPERSEEERELWLGLYSVYLQTQLSLGIYEESMRDAQQICRQLEPDLQKRALPLLVCFLHHAAFRRLYVAPGGKNWNKLPASPLKEGFDSALAELRLSENDFSAEERERCFQTYLELGQPAALEYARRNLRHGTPGVKKMYFDAAMLFADDGEFETAIRMIPEPITQQEANRFNRAIRRRNYPEAEKIALRQPEGNFRDLLFLLYWGERKEYGKLRKRVLELLDAGVYAPRILFSLLEVAEQQKDAALLRRAYALAGSAPDARSANSLGYVSAILGVELEKAEKMLRFALEEEPENSAYQDSFGFLKYRQGKFTEAREWIGRALRNAVPGIGLGVILEHAGDVELALGNGGEALRYWRAALSREDEDRELDAPALRKKIEKWETR